MSKIVILGPANPLRGGIAAFTERLSTEYLKKGDEVSVYSFSLQYPKILFPGKTQFTDDPPPEGVNIIPSVNSVNPVSWRRTAKMILKENPDIVIIMFWIPFMAPALGTIAKKIRKKSSAPVIALVHNIIPHETKPFYNKLSSYFVKHVNGFMSLADAVNKDLSLFDKQKPRLVSPHPLYDHYGDVTDKVTARKQLEIPAQQRLILFFGLVREYKGLDLLIRAMAHEEVKKLNIHLLVAGEFYVNKEKYTNLIDELKVKDNVRIDDCFVPNNKVASYFNASDLVTLPYKTATQSGVTQIAFHFNKPVLVTNVGGLAEIVPHQKAGYVVEKSPEEIALALVDFFQNNREDKFVEGVIENKKRYEWSLFVEQMEKLQQMIIDKN